jgi:hypothetical protein
MKLASLVVAVGLSLAGTAVAHHRPGHVGGGSGNINVNASPTPVVFGAATTVSGKLSGSNSGGQQVTLTEDPFPYDAYVNPRTATTDANGNFTFRLVPASNANYRVAARGEQDFASVRVRMRVGFVASDSTPARGQRVLFSGTVAPKHDGRTALVQRLSVTGAWATVRRTLLRTTTGNRSRYATTLTIRRSGTYRVRVAADGDHLTGTSRTRILRVH